MGIASVLGEVILGWLIADAMTGVFHLWQDGGSTGWPIVGRRLIAPAKLHHDQPLAFTEQGHVRRNIDTYIGVSIVATLWWWALGPSITLLFAAIGGLHVTQVHYWAHRPSKAPSIVKLLQEIGVFQSPKGHAGHHRPPHGQNFCALTDWLNPILNRLLRL